MSVRNNFRHTITASYIGFITQAIVNNFTPLLFVTFNSDFNISLAKISWLIIINFSIQLSIDLLSVKFIDKIGYRIAAVTAHVSAGIGFILLSWLPYKMPVAYTGLIISMIFTSIGGGLTEVIVSPIVEAAPTENKSASMSLLHSFYCWGQLGVTVLSSIFFSYAGIKNWRYMAVIWSVIPFLNAIYFSLVPINTLPTGKEKTSSRKLFSIPGFKVFMLLMFCSGACELSMSQWASAFAEAGLGINKALGDLLGPAAFALLMGISRVLYAAVSNKTVLEKYIFYCSCLCLICYAFTSFSSSAYINLAACSICGFSVGIMWPGVYSIAARDIKYGGTKMFAYLAFAGDLGCICGPSLIGFISNRFSNNLKTGFAFALIFPVIMIIGMTILRRKKVSVNEQ